MTTNPTTIAAELGDWRARAEARAIPDAAMCEQHPTRGRFQCPDCATEAYAGSLAERRAEVIEMANDRCDRLFPRRYQGATQATPEILAWVRQLAADPDNAPSLLLLGPTGTGKTYQAYAALRHIAQHPRPTRGVGFRAIAWQAATHGDILASMRPGPGRDQEAILADYRKAQLLFIDDLGVAKNSEWVEDVTYRLINGRYEDMRPSIFTSNLAIEQLRDALGDRITSRLAETCTRAVLSGTDRRRAPRGS